MKFMELEREIDQIGEAVDRAFEKANYKPQYSPDMDRARLRDLEFQAGVYD